jgi:hypothetical protein
MKEWSNGFRKFLENPIAALDPLVKQLYDDPSVIIDQVVATTVKTCENLVTGTPAQQGEAAATIVSSLAMGYLFEGIPVAKSSGYVETATVKRIRVAKGVTRSLDDLSSLRGATWKEAESLIPKGWTRGPLNKGEGIKFVNPAKNGEQILLEKGWPGAKDPLHSGPYMKVSRNGTVTRIPLQGNPTLK